jgi:hypothetical protein
MPRTLSPRLEQMLRRANPNVATFVELSARDQAKLLRRQDQFLAGPTLVSMTPAATAVASPAGALTLAATRCAARQSVHRQRDLQHPAGGWRPHAAAHRRVAARSRVRRDACCRASRCCCTGRTSSSTSARTSSCRSTGPPRSRACCSGRTARRSSSRSSRRSASPRSSRSRSSSSTPTSPHPRRRLRRHHVRPDAVPAADQPDLEPAARARARRANCPSSTSRSPPISSRRATGRVALRHDQRADHRWRGLRAREDVDAHQPRRSGLRVGAARDRAGDDLQAEGAAVRGHLAGGVCAHAARPPIDRQHGADRLRCGGARGTSARSS